DLVDEGLDLALRISTLADSSLIARKIADMQVVAGGAPALIEQHGLPAHPDALRHLPCIIDVNLQGQSNCRFTEAGRTMSVPVSVRVRVSSSSAARQAAARGLGFGALPACLPEPLVASGELVPILPDFMPTEQTFQGVSPHRPHR